jgi:hypothetical protein
LGKLQIALLKPNTQHNTWKLIHFCIDSCKELSYIENDFRNIGSFMINSQLKYFNFLKIFMDCYYHFKRKSKWNSLWIDLRNFWKKNHGYPLQCSASDEKGGRYKIVLYAFFKKFLKFSFYYESCFILARRWSHVES